ncbi:hypothetical protein B0T16DRAFT_231541 [Cercophora newfieldiana]|uniref:Uncharacterized protein n=1 Tax=Cercophora newfieldiana TaxID=92897 RepID=A0AA40CH99_9PEZI|nr:hypothetical protein B0T16DRAFT_231541 [Cercophora newfieldiana]
MRKRTRWKDPISARSQLRDGKMSYPTAGSSVASFCGAVYRHIATVVAISCFPKYVRRWNETQVLRDEVIESPGVRVLRKLSAVVSANEQLPSRLPLQAPSWRSFADDARKLVQGTGRRALPARQKLWLRRHQRTLQQPRPAATHNSKVGMAAQVFKSAIPGGKFFRDASERLVRFALAPGKRVYFVDHVSQLLEHLPRKH